MVGESFSLFSFLFSLQKKKTSITAQQNLQNPTTILTAPNQKEKPSWDHTKNVEVDIRLLAFLEKILFWKGV